MSRESDGTSSRMVELARSLADPLRLLMLSELMAGPASVSELVEVSGATQPNVSNHLAVLRAGGLVRATRLGRQMVYEIASPDAARLVEALVSISGEQSAARPTTTGLAQARTCYDHLAGRLGVALFSGLVRAGAIRDPEISNWKVGRDRGTVELGPEAGSVFRRFGVEIDEVRRERRHFASYCVDWTERKPHLSGALGAALWRRFLEEGWVVREPGSRAIIVTARGGQHLPGLVPLEVSFPSSDEARSS